MADEFRTVIYRMRTRDHGTLFTGRRTHLEIYSLGPARGWFSPNIHTWDIVKAAPLFVLDLCTVTTPLWNKWQVNAVRGYYRHVTDVDTIDF